MTWIYSDGGAYSIIPQMDSLSSSSDLFKLKHIKSGDINSINMCELADSYVFNYKGTSKLYHRIGCANSIILNQNVYLASLNEFTLNVKYPIVSIIENALSRYSPTFKSDRGSIVYHNFIQGYLSDKVMTISDVINKQFQLVIAK